MTTAKLLCFRSDSVTTEFVSMSSPGNSGTCVNCGALERAHTAWPIVEVLDLYALANMRARRRVDANDFGGVDVELTTGSMVRLSDEHHEGIVTLATWRPTRGTPRYIFDIRFGIGTPAAIVYAALAELIEHELATIGVQP